MCDRPLPQQALCSDLAALIWVLPDAAVVPWLRGFWATMAREWTTGIDVLRMEKFLLLVRRVLAASLVWTQVREAKKPKATKKRAANGEAAAGAAPSVRFDAKRVDLVLGLLANWPFRPDDDQRDEEEKDELMPKSVPAGLRIHAVDIWVDEAEKAGMFEDGEAEDGTVAGKDVLQRLNELVKNLQKTTLSKAVRIRSKESLADERLPWNKKEDEADEAGGDDDEWGGLD